MELLIFAVAILARLVFWVTIAVAGMFLLRVLLTWLGVNPFGRVLYTLTRITEPLVRPLRYQVGRRVTRFDLLPLVAGVFVLLLGLMIWDLLMRITIILAVLDRAFEFRSLSAGLGLQLLIILAGTSYVIALLLRILLPYAGIGYANKFYRFLFSITEPVLKPLRRFLVIGMVDLSPLVVILVVDMITRSLLASVSRMI
ncbi:MAG: YggT family protein [Acidobacteriota bacterium]